MTQPAEARTAGIVLAAGTSRRMGLNKLPLEFEGEPLVRRACRRALAARLEPLVVVLGYEAEKVRAALSGLHCEFAVNDDIGGPLSRSLHVALTQVPPHVEAAVVMLADMPCVTEEMLRALPEKARATGARLVISRFDETIAPPILFHRSLFPELLASTGENPGKAVIERHRDEACVLSWPSSAMFDLDTPEDWSRAKIPG